jgi:hypothetical protein
MLNTGGAWSIDGMYSPHGIESFTVAFSDCPSFNVYLGKLLFFDAVRMCCAKTNRQKQTKSADPIYARKLLVGTAPQWGQNLGASAICLLQLAHRKRAN